VTAVDLGQRAVAADHDEIGVLALRGAQFRDVVAIKPCDLDASALLMPSEAGRSGLGSAARGCAYFRVDRCWMKSVQSGG
jgi:hypothetical protein